MARRQLKRDEEGWLCEADGIPVWRVSALKSAKSPRQPLYCINLKGCNGSGKSTVPIRMIKKDKQTVLLTFSKEDKRPMATYCPQFQVAILGEYRPGTACGGCDSLGNTQVVKELLKLLWKKDVHIMYEGVIVGDIKSTFYELMVEFRKVHPRALGFCFMGTTLKECLRRIQIRNGGKDINEDLVGQKYKNSVTHLKFYLSQGDVECKVLRTSGAPKDVFARFLALYPDLYPIF